MEKTMILPKPDPVLQPVSAPNSATESVPAHTSVLHLAIQQRYTAMLVCVTTYSNAGLC